MTSIKKSNRAFFIRTFNYKTNEVTYYEFANKTEMHLFHNRLLHNQDFTLQINIDVKKKDVPKLAQIINMRRGA